MAISPDRVLRALDRGHRPLLSSRALLRLLGAGRHEARALGAVLRHLEREGRIERLGSRYRLTERGPTLAPPPGRERPGRGPRQEWVGVLGRDGWLRPWRDDARASEAVRLPRAAWGGGRVGDVAVAEPSGVGAEAGRQRRTRRVAQRSRARGRRPAPESPEARVVEVLGPLGTPDADFRAIAWRHRLPLAFPPAALEEAEALDRAHAPAPGLDLRDRPFVTIDPASARDHDDAVWVERTAGGPRLWVAIADVARYVREGSALDVEARRRGNSVYFPDRAVPMLPERLSGDLCSLRPGVDRPALAVSLDVEPDGAVHRPRLESVRIRSRARLVYDDAAEVMEGRPSAGIRDPEVCAQLEALAEVSRRLTARRFADGAIDFDLPTAEIVLGDAGHPTDIIESPRTVAHRAIEEAMLAANRAVAGHLLAHDVPAIFRVHEAPLPESLEALGELLESLGLLDRRTSPGMLEARDIARALQRATGRPEERLVHSVALRSLRQARYDAVNRGHFALAFECYLHFTSPIRRYADLVVHRQLRDLIEGSSEARMRLHARGERLAGWAAALSWCERVAMDAERDAVDLKKCVFLRNRVGERYDGTVTRVSRHGVHVTLDPFFVEGLVPVRTLPGVWDLDERGLAWIARVGSERLQLGDRVCVEVARVDLVRGWIDFAWQPRREARR
jgi:ribonuclease R